MNKTYAMIALCVATAISSGQVLNEDFKLTASDAAEEDLFGYRVAISGSTAIVGAIGDDDHGDFSGSAYLYDATTGQPLFKLTASDAAGGDGFGYFVAISGATAIVGAPFDDHAGERSGSAYLFDVATGQQLFKLTAPDAAEGDLFGLSVAISGTTAIVGAPFDDDAGGSSGSAYMFDLASGQQLFKLTASDAAGGQIGDRFGQSVALSNTTAIVGANLNSDAGFGSGSAYLFGLATGQELFKLTASDAAAEDYFGSSVAISGTTAIVGAHRNNDVGPGSSAGSGSAYVFDVATGQELFKLTASDAAADDSFGYSVAVSGTTAIFGALSDANAGFRPGSAYVFDLATGQQLFKLIASDVAAGDLFGYSVAISGTTVIAGAWRDDHAGTNSGSAYVFDVTTLPCPGDIANELGELNPDGTVSFGDFMAMLTLVGPCPGNTPGCTGDIADDFGTPAPPGGPDGMVSFGDFLALLGLVGPCP